jgi:hypothetical protein
MNAELHRPSNQNFRRGSAVEEGESGVTVELGVTGHQIIPE